MPPRGDYLIKLIKREKKNKRKVRDGRRSPRNNKKWW